MPDALIEYSWDWEHLANLAYRQARKVLRSHEDAMDVAQDVMVALTVLGGNAPHKVDAWVITVARNCAVTRLTHRQRERTYLDHSAVTRSSSFDDEVVGRLVINTWLGRLPPRERQAMWLRFVAGDTRDSIATLMKVKPETVKTMLRRAISKIRLEVSSSAPETAVKDSPETAIMVARRRSMS